MREFIKWWTDTIGAEPLTMEQYKKVEAHINAQRNIYVFENDSDVYKLTIEAPTVEKAQFIINRLKLQKEWKLKS